MFLPDRYIKGECPVCDAKDQYGDACEVCGSGLRAHRADEPVLDALRRDAGAAQAREHFFFKLSDPQLRRLPQALDRRTAGCSPRWLNKVERVVRRTSGMAARDWDISRDAPYFGIEIPDAPGKYFYVWLDAPIGYLASLKNYFDKGRPRRTRGEHAQLRRVHRRPGGGAGTTSSARTSSTSTRCSGRRCCSSAAARCPTRSTCTASSPSRGEKMSKSRGTGIDPLRTSTLGMNPEWLRYYIAAKLNAQGRGHRLQPRRLRRARQRRPDRQVRQHRQPRGGLHRQALRQAGWRRIGRRRGAAGRAAAARRRSQALYEAREFGKALREIMALADEVNAYVRRSTSPGSWRRKARRRDAARRLHDCIEAFRC